MEKTGPKLSRQWFIDSKEGNIKDKYYFTEKLGMGGYGSVYLAKNKESGFTVAVKAIQKTKIEDYEDFVNEMTILKGLDHPNIIKLFETWETERICFLVTENCEGGELFYYITQKIDQKTKKFMLTEREAAVIMKQAFSALHYLHNHQICHRDIKPENFLLLKKGDISLIKMIDFGLSRKLKEEELMSTPKGTPYYIAPEVLGGSYNTLCDNWSMGVLLYILLCGKPPFPGSNNQAILQKVVKGEFNFDHAPFKNASDEVKDLITRLLEKDLEKRITSQ